MWYSSGRGDRTEDVTKDATLKPMAGFGRYQRKVEAPSQAPSAPMKALEVLTWDAKVTNDGNWEIPILLGDQANQYSEDALKL